jgi:TPR repeat protein
MYAEGLGIEKNMPLAVDLYQQAASAGEFFAQIELARMYARGHGIPADSSAGLRWYSAAASQEDRVADCEELQEAKAYVTAIRNG